MIAHRIYSIREADWTNEQQWRGWALLPDLAPVAIMNRRGLAPIPSRFWSVNVFRSCACFDIQTKMDF